MTIKEIQGLLSNDFSVYKQTLLNNQKLIIDKLNAENIFISALETKELADKIDQIKSLDVNEYPLKGVPFAVKDNIDVLGFSTTAGCKNFAYSPKKSSFVVNKLEAAGAICIGKTNMDQFATGLVGVRSPYGIAKNYYNESYIPGGSSSGSASAITANYVPFSLGTDTAGSGRVPAAFQNLIGFKMSKGIVSNSGLVHACKSLDCITVFATGLDDTDIVSSYMIAYDPEDGYSRENTQKPESTHSKIAVPIQENLKFFGNLEYEQAYFNFIDNLKSTGVEIEEIDFSPMFEAAKLLYDGPWIAERYHAVGEFIEHNPADIIDTIKTIILGGKTPTAHSYFDAEYKLTEFKKQFVAYTKKYKAFLMPTAGNIYTLEEIEKDPIQLNSNLGYYTNFMNLLDCAAIALPVAITKNNLPFGVTLFADAFNDDNLLSIAKDMVKRDVLNTSVSIIEYIDLAVCGAHKTGGALNYQLVEIGAVYKSTFYTAPNYRFYALENMSPPRPGLIKDTEKGNKIEVQIWKVPSHELGGFIHRIGAPLGFGKIMLETGEEVTSFLCESFALELEGVKEITHLQTWEAYVESLK